MNQRVSVYQSGKPPRKNQVTVNQATVNQVTVNQGAVAHLSGKLCRANQATVNQATVNQGVRANQALFKLEFFVKSIYGVFCVFCCFILRTWSLEVMYFKL